MSRVETVEERLGIGAQEIQPSVITEESKVIRENEAVDGNRENQTTGTIKELDETTVTEENEKEEENNEKVEENNEKGRRKQ